MRHLIRDLRHAVRLLFKQPGFTLAAVATLALGIGANTAMFALARATLLTPVAAAAPERLVAWPWTSAYPDYVEYAKRFDQFEGVMAWRSGRIGLSHENGATDIAQAMFVSGNAFSVLGVGAAAGRTLRPADDVLNAPVVAMVSHDYWRTRFGSNPSAVGRTLRMNGRDVTVVGVVDAGFHGIAVGQRPAVYLPLASTPQVQTGFFASLQMFETRNFVWLNVIGRLRPEVTAAQASSAMDTLYRTVNPPRPDRVPERLTLMPLATRALGADRAGNVRRFVTLLIAVVAITLLIGCANLASLLLARGAARRQEIGVRLAIGATRAQVARQLLVESLALATCGGLAGLGVAAIVLRLLSAYQLPGGLEIAELALGIDGWLLAVALLLSVATGVLFGVVPAWRTARTDVMITLRDETRGSTGPTRLRSGLVAAQIALSLVLLAGSGLFVRSLVHALALPTGFTTDGVVTASVSPSLARYDAAQATAFYDTALARVQALPGVRAAGWTSLIPVSGAMMRQLRVDGGNAAAADAEFYFSYVGPGYFGAAGIPLLEGRALESSDTLSSPLVAVVNRAAAEKHWPGRSPVGARVGAGDEWRTVVGVVENTTVERLDEAPVPYVYFPIAQVTGGLWTSADGAHLFVRVDGEAHAAVSTITTMLRSVDASMPLQHVVPFAHHVRELVMPQRLGVLLLAFFSLLAVSLATVGVYGVASYVAALRRREIGIRMALGADRRDIRRIVLAHGVWPALAGIPAGLLLTAWLARFAQAFLHDVRPTDPPTLLAVSVLLLVVALAATWLPARRASRIDPADALRQS